MNESIYLAHRTPALMGVGKLGSMYGGELASINKMGSGQDSDPGPCVHQAQP